MSKAKPRVRQWRAIRCGHCDFSSGHRGMDRCSRCDGTGEQIVYLPTGDRYPNTKTGWDEMVAEHGEQVE